jgi:hypothetical protein
VGSPIQDREGEARPDRACAYICASGAEENIYESGAGTDNIKPDPEASAVTSLFGFRRLRANAGPVYLQSTPVFDAGAPIQSRHLGTLKKMTITEETIALQNRIYTLKLPCL